MNDMIYQMIKATLDAFNMYPISNPALQQQVDDYKARLTAFAERQNDIGAFYGNYAASGLQEEYMSLITKVAMSGTSAAPADSSGSNATAASLPTVREYLMQYQSAYNELCNDPQRARGKAAYEQLFAVAERTDDMLEAQLIIERERLLWKIVAEDSLGIFENTLSQMDPLSLATTASLHQQIKAYEKADSDEELSYLLEKTQWPVAEAVAAYTCKMTIAATVASLLLKYTKAKNEVYLWNEKTLKNAVKSVLEYRSTLRKTLNVLHQLDMTVEELFRDEGAKIWMLSPENADQFGKHKYALHPQNYDAYLDVLKNEIMADIAPEALLKRKPEKVVWFA